MWKMDQWDFYGKSFPHHWVRLVHFHFTLPLIYTVCPIRRIRRKPLDLKHILHSDISAAKSSAALLAFWPSENWSFIFLTTWTAKRRFFGHDSHPKLNRLWFFVAFFFFFCKHVGFTSYVRPHSEPSSLRLCLSLSLVFFPPFFPALRAAAIKRRVIVLGALCQIHHCQQSWFSFHIMTSTTCVPVPQWDAVLLRDINHVCSLFLCSRLSRHCNINYFCLLFL